jgi:hypothetical protein
MNVKTAHIIRPTWNLARRLTKHGCHTIHRWLMLTQMLFRWWHQSGNFSIKPCIWTCCAKCKYVNGVCWYASIYNIQMNVLEHITDIWTLAGMCQLVSSEVILPTECLFTHITGIWTKASICQLLLVQIRLLINVFLHTSHTHGRWPVCVSWWCYKYTFN